jgi:hypothetical protein
LLILAIVAGSGSGHDLARADLPAATDRRGADAARGRAAGLRLRDAGPSRRALGRRRALAARARRRCCTAGNGSAGICARTPRARSSGVVFTVPPEAFRRLDRYERAGVRYLRERKTLADGSEAWVYRLIAWEGGR